jgi:SH3-like domain-containing protein
VKIKLPGLVLAVLIGAFAPQGPAAAAQDGVAKTAPATGPSGLPLPRFVSLKSNRVNVRKGPGTDYPVAWIFSQAGLPVEVIAEFENWRQVRDSEGAEGWVFHALLSGRRTALIMPWAKEKQLIVLHARAAANSAPVARVETGVLGSISTCDGEWCEFSVNGYSGYVEQERLWGVYRGERIN